MADRKRSTSRSVERKTTEGTRRRVTREAGRMADYSSLKSSSGIVVPEIKKVLLARRREDYGGHRTSIIYPSEMAKSDWCPRASYYRMTGYPEPESKSSFTLENVFAQGNAIHDKWQGWLSETGKLWGDWRCSRCSEYVKNSPKPGDYFSGSCVGTGWVRIEGMAGSYSIGTSKDLTQDFSHDWRYKEVTLKSASLPVSGHADGALTDHNILIELKSLGVGSLRFEAPKLLEANTHTFGSRKVIDIEKIWKDFHRPLTSHLKQGNIYLWMAKEMGLPFDRISFIYEFKANQQVKEFVVPYSEEIINPILETAEYLKMCIADGKKPQCPSGGCSSCKAYERAELDRERNELMTPEWTIS